MTNDTPDNEGSPDGTQRAPAPASPESAPSPPRETPAWKPALLLTVVFLAIYGGTFGSRLLTHSGDNHFVFQADSFLKGRLDLVRNPPHGNDWVRYNDKWYVSFPPFPAVLMMPGVKIWGYDFNDRLFTWIFTPLPVLLLFLALERLRRRGRIGTSMRENAGLASLFGAGTVYYFVAVQGTVWFTALVVGATLFSAYILCSLEGRRPLLAGLFLGLGFMTRTPLLFGFPLFVYEAMRDPDAPGGLRAWLARLFRWPVLKKLLLFAVFPAIIVAAAMVINSMRFDSPFEFGHRHLNVLWTSKFSKWGLFNYHFVSKNLACMLALLPWLSRIPPYITISGHGLALWFTTPVFLYLLWPKEKGGLHAALWATTAAVAIPSIFYQNTGWVQFGYRFAVDYMPLLILLLAAGKRELTRRFWVLVALGVAVNLFGAVTFGRMPQFYSPDQTQLDFFQPD